MEWNADNYPERDILKNILLLWLTLHEADKSVSLWKRLLCWVNFVPLVVCEFRLGCWAEQRSWEEIFTQVCSLSQQTRSAEWLVPGCDFSHALPIREGQELQVVQELFAHRWWALHVGALQFQTRLFPLHRNTSLNTQMPPDWNNL